MKKILIFTMLLPLLTNAQSITTNEDADINVVVGEVDAEETAEIEIKWDQMVFTYNVVENYNWNSSTHKYEKEIGKSYWSNSGNKIVVTNKSSKKINVNPTYFSRINSLSGTFNSNKFGIDGYATKTIMFNIDGVLEKGLNNTKIGYITIEIDDV